MRVQQLSESTDQAKRFPRGTILCVVGARPNFMKIAPILGVFKDSTASPPACLVHTGQHYDADMKDQFFTQLGIPEPDLDLEVGSASHAVQTAEIMRRFEPVIDDSSPSAVVVVGDVNSTIACALVAAKKGVPVVHVEAGLRSFDRTMPEEVNRVLTDQISDLLFTTERSARTNLVREGIPEDRIHFVGNVMIDTLLAHRRKAVPPQTTLAKHIGIRSARACVGGYAVLTLHRPSNVDDRVALRQLIRTVSEVGEKIPVLFAVHPRTRRALDNAGLLTVVDHASGILCLPPLGYLEMLGLMAGAKFVLTDSGGMQEETTALGVPCLTLRENTERPITVEQGTNTVVGRDPERIMAVITDILKSGGKVGRTPELWDGKAATRIRDVMAKWLGQRQGIRRPAP